jgi:hypothetical protein
MKYAAGPCCSTQAGRSVVIGTMRSCRDKCVARLVVINKNQFVSIKAQLSGPRLISQPT